MAYELKPKPLSLVFQMIRICELFPNATVDIRQGKMICRLDIQPKADSDTYRIKIEYVLQKRPNVYVLSPELKEGCKHLYCKQSARLCLWYPRAREWTPQDYIAETILPWAYVWLSTYEYWCITDEWIHDEAPHPIRAKDAKN